ncbi:MAG TPA: ATP-binding protein [Actinomycetota bacterium]|nr:ATP-binding protein [Actinomycetota bacterium]
MEGDILTSYRLRTVRIGVWATVFVLIALVVYPFVPGGESVDTGPYLITLAVAAAGVAVIAALPWPRLFRAGTGLPVMYAWSAADILLVTFVVRYSGTAGSGMFFLYAFTTVFFMVSYPRRAQAALLGLTFASYLSVLAAMGWPGSVGGVIVRLSLVGILAYFARFLSDELRREIAGRAEAHAESERRAALLEAVARAAGSVSDLDSGRVLRRVVSAAQDIGFEAADLGRFDEAGDLFVTLEARGMPDGYDTARPHPASAGISGLVREQRRAVVLNDYAGQERAIAGIRRAGFRAVVGVPVWIRGRLSGVLAAGSRDRRHIRSEDVEALELLAAIAGRALENAQRFEDEHRTVERLAELDRMKSDFISTASHELRTPLTVIHGMGFTLEQQWERLDEETRLELIQRLNENTRTLHGIVNTLLDFSRLESGRIEVDRRPVPLPGMIAGILSRVEPLLGDHAIAVEIEEDLTVDADRLLLDRVLENLIVNAAKHTPPGTSIVVWGRREGPAAAIAVADTGPGIPPEDLRHLGSRFFRGGEPNTRRSGGTGLGLALVGEILRVHGSALEVRSEVGHGSRFSFRLPLAEVAAEHQPA